MSSNELPSNMGKKIADALKKQNKTVKESAVDVVEEVQETVKEPDFENSVSELHNENSLY